MSALKSYALTFAALMFLGLLTYIRETCPQNNQGNK